MDSHYRDQTPHLKILILPFPGNVGQTALAENLLNKRLDLLREKDKLPISVVFKCMSKNWGNRRYFTPESARKEGEEEGADLVIFGDILPQQPGKPKIALQYVIMEPGHGFDNEREKMVGKTFEYAELMTGSVPNELDAVVFWCLGIREFLQGNYEETIRYFLEIPTDSDQEKEDIYFRIGVIYDWLQKSKLAIHYYALALEAGGLISTWKEISLWTKSGDLIAQDEIMEPEKFKSKNIKMLLFEIVRIQHALLLKKHGSSDHAKKYLEQAVDFIQQSWLESAYRELIASAYFSLAQLCKTPTKNGRIRDPDKAIAHYFSAIKLGKGIPIHQSAADFFLRYNYLETAIEIIKEHHGEDTELLVHYTDKLNNQ